MVRLRRETALGENTTAKQAVLSTEQILPILLLTLVSISEVIWV